MNLFRINLSHTKVSDIPKTIELVNSFTSVPLCLDTEGAQIRTGRLKNDLFLKNNEKLIIKRQEGMGDSQGFNLYPAVAFEKLEVGDIINIDFNSVMVQVIDKNNDIASIRVIMGGLIQQNKAVSINKEVHLDPLTEKDLQSISLGLELGIKHFALSFANKATDVKSLRSLISSDCSIISKIESIKGLKNLRSIAKESNAILIDRGDLSREISIEKLPATQKYIIDHVKKLKTDVYVATNLLESMIKNVSPTRAEINDIYNTLSDGADGLVLAAETAIGDYPIQCATMIKKMIVQFENFPRKKVTPSLVTQLIKKESLVLPKPHGGELVNQQIGTNDIPDINKMQSLTVDLEVMMDIEQICIGAFSPLTGFMNKEEINSVLDDFTLPNGIIWTLPIFLQINSKNFANYKQGESILIKLSGIEEPFASLKIDSLFKMNLDRMAKKMFSTNDLNHPGVKKLFAKGDSFFSGKVSLLKRIPSKYKHYEITPFDSREIMENKGWSRVVGFHTRNIPHRVHEFIQSYVLENYLCDGILTHPVIGPKKSGDYVSEVIIKTYEILIDKYIENSLLGAFQTYSRYAGPREALFTAICRKNFGCSHFIIGRDHTGVGAYYSSNDFNNLYSKVGDIGIKLIILDEFAYSKEKKSYINISKNANQDIETISGSDAREMFYDNKKPPNWYIREEISNFIIDRIKKGKEVFIK